MRMSPLNKKPQPPWYEGLLDAVLKEREPASRSYRYLSRLIEREYPTQAGGVALAFCSPDDDALSSTVLLMLAYCLQSELGSSVLLVDARAKDGGGGLSRRLALDAQAGYAELLADGPANFDQMRQPSGIDRVAVLPRGAQDGAPLVVQRQHLAALLAQARARHDYVLVQLGSVISDTRNLVTATHADAVLLLAHEDRTLLRTLDAAQQLLHDNGVADVRAIIAAKKP